MSFILYENHCIDATIDSETTITNFGFSNAVDGRTNTQCGITGDTTTKTIDLDFGSSLDWDVLCIARHNFASAANGTTDTIIIYGKVNSGDAWTQIDSSVTPASNDIYVKTFTGVTYRYCRIAFVFSSSDAYMADISVGERLVLERSQKFGFTKPDFADNDKVIPNITRGQNLVGLNIDQMPKRVRFRLFYYTASFFTDWNALVTALKLRPIYIRWRSTEKAFYCWPNSAIPQPSYSASIQNYYDVTLDMMGITE